MRICFVNVAVIFFLLLLLLSQSISVDGLFASRSLSVTCTANGRKLRLHKRRRLITTTSIATISSYSVVHKNDFKEEKVLPSLSLPLPQRENDRKGEGAGSSAAGAFQSATSLYDPNYSPPSPQWYSPDMVIHSEHIIRSYHNLTGQQLVPLEILERNPVEAAQRLFFLPNTVVLSHGTQFKGNGPILNYGNSLAMQRFEACWEELTSLPSRFTASDLHRQDREVLMTRVRQDGIIRDYCGLRNSLHGKKFYIKKADVWNIVINGTYIGQAAVFSDWEDVL